MGLFSKPRCPYGCGAERGFCQCGKSNHGDRKLTGKARQTTGGRVVKGHTTGGKQARRGR